MSNTRHTPPQGYGQRYPQPVAQMLYCHPCTKELADIVRPYAEHRQEVPSDLEVPQPTPAYTNAVFIVQSLPVTLPVCFRHFLEATKSSTLLQP